MVYRPPPFHPNRPTLVPPVQVDPTGQHGPTRAQTRTKAWRTSYRGRYVPTTAPVAHPQQRSVEAATLMRIREAVTGWAALNWLGAAWFTGTRGDGSLLAVPLVTRREVTAQEGVRISQEHLRDGERVVVDGLPVTEPVRSVSYEVRHAAWWWDAVVAVDMACYSDLVTISELAAYARAIGPWTGIGQLRKVVAYADENSWSPQEVRMRLVWEVVAERPRPLCNTPVFDHSGRHVATPDLLDPVAGVAGDYDGSVHLVGAQRTKDVRREGELRALGLEYVTMLSSDRSDGYRSFLARLATAYDRAATSDGTRRWTIQRPRGWVDTSSVTARRRLSSADRRRLLRYRRPA